MRRSIGLFAGLLLLAGNAGAESWGFPENDPKYFVDLPEQGWTLHASDDDHMKLEFTDGGRLSILTIPNSPEHFKQARDDLKAFTNNMFRDVSLEDPKQSQTETGLPIYLIFGSGQPPDSEERSMITMAWAILDKDTIAQIWLTNPYSTAPGNSGLAIVNSLRSPGMAEPPAADAAAAPAGEPAFSGRSALNETARRDILENINIAFSATHQCSLEAVEAEFVKVNYDEGVMVGNEEIWTAKGCGKSAPYRVLTTLREDSGIDFSITEVEAGQ